MAKVKSTFDVFISHSQPDAGISEDIARVLRSYDLKVFTDAEVMPGRSIEDAIWEAMSESQALVAVIPESIPDAWIAFEMGAAKAWNKPIYAVASDPSMVRLPAGLQGMTIYPPSRIEEIAQEIRNASGLLSESDQSILTEEYQRIGVPLDQLMLQPSQLASLARQFKKRAKRNVAAEELVRTLLRLRKSGRLRPSPVSKSPKAS